MVDISPSKPPTPISLKLNPNLVRAFVFIVFECILKWLFSEANSMTVSIARKPKLTMFFEFLSSFSGPKGSISSSHASIVIPIPLFKKYKRVESLKGDPTYNFLIISRSSVSSTVIFSSNFFLGFTLNFI